ncbi:MAG: zinc-dependent peptidase [Gammaproteobacteria bacterium]|nr:zinc-dependent peptidase [Gammaproteobacteria bacterium]
MLQRWRRPPLPDGLWHAALDHTPYVRQLAPTDRQRLRELATEFLHTKTFEGAAGIRVTPPMRALIALRACVPVLHLGLDWYDGWNGIVLYPTDFRVHEEYEDETGVVHRGQSDLCGQSIARGPMVLSWEAIEHAPAPNQDLVIHECAHKLDTLNGPADGFPPLHAGMDAAQWTRDFTTAFEALNRALEAGAEPRLDPYAAEHPAEFFAVTSETFFTEPALLYADFPAVYRQLCLFYRQEPIATP